jgi:1,4-alpha-glucan branching enzyme
MFLFYFVFIFLLSGSCLFASELYTTLGAHKVIEGTKFAVFAPNAKKVSVVINNRHKIKMAREENGSWCVVAKGITQGTHYQYLIQNQANQKCKKLDPFAIRLGEKKKGKYSSIVHPTTSYNWNDSNWLKTREKFADPDMPVSIYEVHVNSWKKGLSYKKLAKELAAYCTEMGFTHVELFGLLAHTSEQSWGYRPISYFAPNHRLNGAFEEFVDVMHLSGIGVIVDWVPGHFSSNSMGLLDFDGTDLFEYPDARRAWGATLFDYSKEWTQDFLLSSINFWLREMHVDGFRVDSLDVILDRATNTDDVKQFMQKMNAFAKAHNPGILMIAESWKTDSVTSKDGFGFDFKWTGATNSILKFLKMDYERRYDAKEFNRVKRALTSQKNERLLWHTDHDKSRKETGSLYQQMPGTHFEKCANVRLLLSYFMTLVGKKMIFMGDELAQVKDWDSGRKHSSLGVEWQKQEEVEHQGVQQMVKALNMLYKELPDLHKQNSITCLHVDLQKHLLCYRRGALIFVTNFARNAFQEYKVPCKTAFLREIFNSDDVAFGGSGKMNPLVTCQKAYFTIQIPALSTLIFQESST